MTKAQLGCRLVELNTTIGIGYHLTKQITLAIGLTATVKFAGTMLDIPEGIVDLPHQVEIIGVEESHQVSVLIIVGVQLEKTHLHEIIAKLLLVDDLLHDIRILEDHLHQSGVTHAMSGIGIVSFLGLGCHIATTQLAVLMIHIPLVAL